MKVDALAHAGDHVNTELSNIVSRLRGLSETVSDSCKDTYHDVERSMRKLKIAAEEGIDDTRKQIKGHPLASLALVASGAFLLGGLTVKLTDRHGRH